jgi:hypothetical protein
MRQKLIGRKIKVNLIRKVETFRSGNVDDYKAPFPCERGRKK